MEGEDNGKECNNNEEDEENREIFPPRGVSKMMMMTTTMTAEMEDFIPLQSLWLWNL